MCRKEKKMNQKVMLILLDGLRPDALTGCKNPYSRQLLTMGSYSLEAATVYPSVTLPCHMSLFHSVTPERHGILTNTYVPMSRPVKGLCEQLHDAGKTCAFFYDWEELRDLSLPSALASSFFVSGEIYDYARTCEIVTDNALSYIAYGKPDFAFIYFGNTDHAGHDHGWMSEKYDQACSLSLDKVRSLVERFEGEYNIIITADHGGHGRDHGTRLPEDMTIPIIGIGEKFPRGKVFPKAGICDIAPTIAALEGVAAHRDWEGKSLL